MTAETIAIISVGATILVALLAAYIALRRNSNERFSTIEEKVDALSKDFYTLKGEIKGRLQSEFEREMTSVLMSRTAKADAQGEDA